MFSFNHSQQSKHAMSDVHRALSTNIELVNKNPNPQTDVDVGTPADVDGDTNNDTTNDDTNNDTTDGDTNNDITDGDTHADPERASINATNNENANNNNDNNDDKKPIQFGNYEDYKKAFAKDHAILDKQFAIKGSYENSSYELESSRKRRRLI